MGSAPGNAVAVLFSGGDAPGMNPFLRAFVRLGLNRHAARVLGVKDGYQGLVRVAGQLARGETTLAQVRSDLYAHPGTAGLLHRGQDVVEFDHLAVTGLVSRGGIVLGCARCPSFLNAPVRAQTAALLADLGIAALVVVGGDGSLRGAARLAAESALPVVGVPATIDNDLPVSELALGVDTAVNTLAGVVGHFNDTASSHHRIMVLETMGRDSGQLAQTAALASGAELVVTPERGPLDTRKMRSIAERLENSLKCGRQHAIVLVAEGVPRDTPGSRSAAQALAEYLQQHFAQPESPFPNQEIRVSVLGHLQRGGSPTAADRILAARFAEAAWEALSHSPRRSGVVALREGRVALCDFAALEENGSPTPIRQTYLLQKAISDW